MQEALQTLLEPKKYHFIITAGMLTSAMMPVTINEA